jgi:hypothetical protein
LREAEVPFEIIPGVTGLRRCVAHRPSCRLQPDRSQWAPHRAPTRFVARRVANRRHPCDLYARAGPPSSSGFFIAQWPSRRPSVCSRDRCIPAGGSLLSLPANWLGCPTNYSCADPVVSGPRL